MKKEKRALIKNFNAIVKDLLDNYDKYTDEERAQVKEVFEKARNLNAVLDKYDVEKKSVWKSFVESYGNYFDMMI